MKPKVKTIFKEILWRAQSGKCCYCDKHMAVPFRKHQEEADRLSIARADVPRRLATVEHLRRKADGGSNLADNLALACADCNHHRGDRDWLTYKSIRLGEISA